MTLDISFWEVQIYFAHSSWRQLFNLLVLKDPIWVVCFVTENYVIYHLFCNIIRKGLRQVILGLGHLGKGVIFDMVKEERAGSSQIWRSRVAQWHFWGEKKEVIGRCRNGWLLYSHCLKDSLSLQLLTRVALESIKKLSWKGFYDTLIDPF